jgi:ACT domain-containing protein
MEREALALAVSEIVLRHLPEGIPSPALEGVVADLVLLLEGEAGAGPERADVRHIVFTSLGRNRPGIVHAFSEVLARCGVDIVDLNQTLVHGNFAMMMILDPSQATVSFEELRAALKKRGEELGVLVFVQYEDMMRAVNRI